MRGASLIAACLSVGAVSISALAQEPPPSRPLTLQIVDSATSQPLIGAEISVPGTRRTDVTPGTGVLRVAILTAGDTLHVRRLGYRPIVIPTALLDADQSFVKIGLVPIPRNLAEVTIEARMDEVLSGVGFFERRKRLSGFFIDPGQMTEMHPARTSEIFERAPGARLSAAASGGRNLRFARAQNCPPIVYIDGVLLINEPPVYRATKVRAGTTRTSESATDILGQQDQGIDEVGVRQIAAVEAYPTAAQAPPPFNGTGSNCGVVLFWTWNSVTREH